MLRRGSANLRKSAFECSREQLPYVHRLARSLREHRLILPKERDPRFVTIRRGGTLTDSDHHLLGLWAASCAEHVLDLFESARPEDLRPRRAIELGRAWARGEITMTQARSAGGHAMAAARDLSGAPRHAAYAAPSTPLATAQAPSRTRLRRRRSRVRRLRPRAQRVTSRPRSPGPCPATVGPRL